MLNMRRSCLALALVLFASPAFPAENFISNPQLGVAPVAPIVGCSDTGGPCSGPVSATNPMPTAGSPSSSSAFAISHGVVTSLGTSLVAKASAGNLYGFNCTAITGGAAGYCVAVNAAAAPSTGAISGVLDACYFAAGTGGCSLARPNFPANYSTGIVILVTSAVAPFTYTTGVDTAFISADFQ